MHAHHRSVTSTLQAVQASQHKAVARNALHGCMLCCARPWLPWLRREPAGTCVWHHTCFAAEHSVHRHCYKRSAANPAHSPAAAHTAGQRGVIRLSAAVHTTCTGLACRGVAWHNMAWLCHCTTQVTHPRMAMQKGKCPNPCAYLVTYACAVHARCALACTGVASGLHGAQHGHGHGQGLGRWAWAALACHALQLPCNSPAAAHTAGQRGVIRA